MSIGFGLLKSLLADGLDSFVLLANNGVTADVFQGDEHTVYSALEQFYLTYGSLPSTDTLTIASGISVPWDNFPAEPIMYWIDQIKERALLLSAGNLINRARDAIGHRNLTSLRDYIQQAYVGLEEGINDHSVQSLSEASREAIIQHNQIQQTYELPGIPFAFPYLNLISGGAFGGDLISLIGRPGCLAGDTQLYFERINNSRSSGWYTIKDAYYKFNRIYRKGRYKSGGRYFWEKNTLLKTQCLKDAELTGLGEIDQILYSGKKSLFKVITESGKTIRVTKEHPFKVPKRTKDSDSNGYKQLQCLKVGDIVICKAPKTPKKIGITENRKHRKTVSGVKYHPYAWRLKENKSVRRRIYYSVIVYEARLNNLTVGTYIEILKTNKEKASTLKYSLPGKVIHHIDENPLNDSIDNLEELSDTEHRILHSIKDNNRKHFGLNFVQEERIVSIEKQGVEDTYDIVMKHPYYNYIANEFVVHNTGKSYLLLNDANNAHNHDKKVLFVSMEMPNVQCARRILSLRTGVNYTRFRLGRVSSFGIQRLESEVSQIENQLPFNILSGGIFGSIDRIYAQVKHYRPDILYIDGAYLVRTVGKAGQRWERTLQVLEILKQIALIENIPVFITFQFNKTAPGTLEGIAYSDAVAQLSSIALSVESEGTDDEDIRRPIQYKTIKILKGREGETGKIRIELDFDQMIFRQESVIAGLSDDLAYETSEDGLGGIIDDNPVEFI